MKINIKSVKKKGIEGILDPFASGLLIIATGHYTRYLSYFASLTRTYHAKLLLGELTDTLDPTGMIIKKESYPKRITETQIKDVMKSLTGIRKQIPPIFSNVKVGGVPARKIARKEKTLVSKPLELAPREINVFRLELLSFDEKNIDFAAEVSSGTYIRSLGLEIAEGLGTIGRLSYLRRVQVGNFKLDVPPTKPNSNIQDRQVTHIKIQDALYWLDPITLPQGLVSRLQHGQRVVIQTQSQANPDQIFLLQGLKASSSQEKVVQVLNAQDQFYGLAKILLKRNEHEVRPLKMLPIT